ncbi:hypothetical protein OG874_39380 [Nocardia sp. NBC_00565]|uniref:hypothetical protein n=1 Tax=Nocardia sp. NBC_00565 TaxID=2975993 RepID=UPI002E804AFF|nr:hypothetical protein [Nocardia sp. NBC_00565]WUC02702.1 hypothetical protein OG874_39380 [Nocardia sp. NBC_00565]
MRPTPTAIGFIHRDISGSSQAWDTAQIRKLAKRLGYDIAEIVLLDSTATHIVAALREVIRDTEAEAVIMPNLAHLDNQPAALVRVCDVITVNPVETYDRHSLPPIRMQAE